MLSAFVFWITKAIGHHLMASSKSFLHSAYVRGIHAVAWMFLIMS